MVSRFVEDEEALALDRGPMAPLLLVRRCDVTAEILRGGHAALPSAGAQGRVPGHGKQGGHGGAAQAGPEMALAAGGRARRRPRPAARERAVARLAALCADLRILP